MKDQWLANTKRKLEQGCLTVGYFGGSITCGSGASDVEKTSWRAGVTAWLTDLYPSADIKTVNAALGGTGSDLAAFRCRRDLISKLPDLVFVEFSVNDGGMEKEWCQRSMEGIVRHIWGHRGDVDIVFVYTAITGFGPDYEADRLPKVASWHQEIADYYGIPSVNVGAALWKVVDKAAPRADYLPDGVHPSDKGYEVYTDKVCRFLEESLENASMEPLPMVLPPSMTEDPLWDGQLIDSWRIMPEDAIGWNRVDDTLCGAYPHYIQAAEPDSELTLRFDGTVIGLYWMVGDDSGNILWSVDGGEYQESQCWDEWGAMFQRANYRILKDDLSPGTHTLKVKVSSEAAQESKGTAIRIAAFLVAGHSGAEQLIEKPSSAISSQQGWLAVNSEGRFLQHTDGSPFFWLADTTWELFHRTSKEEADFYLEDRRRKGFTAVQAVVVSEFDGLTEPNYYGFVPFVDSDPTKPVEGYFKHVDYVVESALARGICVGILPTWGDKAGPIMWGKGPIIFNPENAEAFGLFLGRRYASYPNVVWILGGDRPVENTEALWDAMAKGIKQGDDGRHLITYHPMGGSTSAKWLHDKDWLDFNMLQSGHGEDINLNYRMVEADYFMAPPKPCTDGEPPYEDHPVNWKTDNRYFDDFDARRSAYWSVFAGAHGHTYGCNDIWQFWTPERGVLTGSRTLWWEALDLPGAYDMIHLKRLMLSRPFFSRKTSQAIVVGGQSDGIDHVRASAGDGYAMVYIPQGKPVTVDLRELGWEETINKVKAWWYDPRTGVAKEAGDFATDSPIEFTPPTSGWGNDWVVVIDDGAKDYPLPGQVR